MIEQELQVLALKYSQIVFMVQSYLKHFSMKVSRKKRLILYVLMMTFIILLFSPIYMYFSHDVEKLKTQWPHITEPVPGEAESRLEKSKPKNWVALNQISSFAKWAIVLSEDWSFYQHEGVDVEQMKVALGEMMTGDRFRGASTITQQMVKNVFLSEQRTLWRKIHELILAQKVEKVLTKDKILEVYLNVIEFGPSIYGIKKASYHYFKKSPAALNPSESAFLAMLLPSPKRYYVSYKKKKLTKFARKRVNAILKKLRMGKVITFPQYDTEVNSKLAWEN